MEKFMLTDEKQQTDGITLYRIAARKPFDGVKAGEVGGWIETETNLSQDGNCWVHDWECMVI
ncbi:hypothetical protein SK355_07100 [Candidatus Fukatsuia symbiotica]|uniref:Uncharacterized protein n=1 Tax=Candidatus Fukatsuia symbiotica TaxID=1878942 RepID=A0A2U8I6D6_9GAMM|nr:hypothetical protein [Candidatus Fukatsuia symbiotica]AWK14712.1 hypothetical protein CCS41_09850 [Candidatus Fukatsuia symbiotica]MEA9445038.1 hypothetical protein [Candidatus Fukatsuia symbiotica]